MGRRFVLIAGASGAIGVGLGAFGAHGLQNLVSGDLLNTFETGVRYQMYHALALLLVAVLPAGAVERRWATAAGRLFVIGTIIFSGSLYLLVLTDLRWLGAITPLGGAAFVAGWACLAWAAWKRDNAR
jgi:uncharacterized membrane protein YgdD (TMEM256/DUF423 family)